ncbi:hypothetical protein MASR1M60_22660 [Rhodocyclaceae bacterium]
MADEKKQAVDIEDIDGPIEIKQTQGAHKQRVGVSKNGLAIAGALGLAVVVMVGAGIINAGPSGGTDSKTSSGSTDMPGQNPAISVAKMAAEAEAKRRAEAPPVDGLQVRGSESSPTKVGTAPQQQSPRELHVAWLEKKHYERIQGRILAADLALTADVSKGGGGGIRPVAAPGAASEDMSNPLARLTGLRNTAHSNAMAGQVPGMLAAQGAAGVVSANPATSLAAGGDPNVAAQLRNREFLKEAAEAGYLPERVKTKMGQHELAAGSIIPAVMLTGINSELPGVITAQVRQSVYDTFNESALVVPQGSRIVGRYSSQVAYGQERVLVAWDEMILPNGNRINLRGMAGADGLGQAGFGDQVNTHFWRVWGSSLMVSMLGVGVQLSQPQNSSVNNSPTASQQAAGAAANSMNQAGSKILEKNMNTAPTLTIRPGYAFNVIVNKSINFPAYLD